MDKLEIDINDIVSSLTEQVVTLSKEKAMLTAQVNALIRKLDEEANEKKETE